MKILLVSPDVSAKEESQNDFVYFSSLVNKPGKKKTSHKSGVLPLALPTLAALTPPEFEVRILDENIEDIDFDAPVDIVGITFLTCYAPQGYRLADRFRAAGAHVALGGVHVTMCPEEAMEHADTVFLGEADDTWEMFLEDFESGTPKRLYRADKRPDLKRLVIPRWDLVQTKHYRSNLVQTSRGCLFDCDFCSLPSYIGTLRTKPVENVIAEIEATKALSRFPGLHYVYFADEDITCDKQYAKRLFEAMIPLGVRWVSQTSLNIAKDDELLELAAESGCEAVFIGFESIDQENLDSVGKGKLNRVGFFKEAIDKIHRKGIAVFGFIMFGFDGDDPRVFQDTVDFMNETSVVLPIINILGPLPGTRFHERMKVAGRLLEAGWELYDARNVLFMPKRMSPEALQNGADWSIRELYSADALLRRIDRLWETGGLRGGKNYFLFRVLVSLLLAWDSLSRERELAAFIRRMIREMWVKKNINLTMVFAALSFYDFARRVPAVERPPAMLRDAVAASVAAR